MMKNLKIYLIFGIIVIALTLFFTGCLGKISTEPPSTTPPPTELPPTTTQSANQSLPILPPVGQSNFWRDLKYGGIGFATGVVICVLIWLFLHNLGRNYGYDRRETSRWKDEANDYKKELNQVTRELEQKREKYDRYNRFDLQIPAVEQQYRNILKEVETRFPQLIENDFKDLINEPAKEYWAYIERARALKSIGLYFINQDRKAQALRQECLDLINEIKDEEPDLFVPLKMAISSTSGDGLQALQPILKKLKNRAAKKPVSAELRNELALLEKSLESVRDYSYRLIPSRLIKFANELIELPASEKENILREKTVREIMALVNQYLHL